jgi:GNAT superfamily N-acetyltransferase
MAAAMATVRDFDNDEAFWREVAEPLRARPVLNNVFVGVAHRMRHAPSADHLRFGAFDSDQLILGALRTPPFRLNLADVGRGPTAIDDLVTHMAEHNIQFPGVFGDERLADAFADRWCRMTGQRRDGTNPHGRRQNLYQVERIAPPRVEGRMRPARSDERGMLVAWEQGFAVDAGLGAAERDPSFVARVVDETLADKAFRLWEVDDKPVATARLRRISTVGARVSGVYTPPELRGRGYAAALTAALSQHVLDAGLFCCLSADAGNPLTNRLYQRIGYVRLATYANILFSRD